MLSVSQLSAQTGGYSNLEFVENRGQWDTAVKFRAEMGTGTFFLTKNGFTVLLLDTTDLKALQGILHGDSKSFFRPPAKTAGSSNSSSGVVNGPGGLHYHVYRVSFQNANAQVQIIPDKVLPSYNNYFIGKDPSRWASNCKLYQGVLYKNLYEGIDLHYYTDNGVLKYDLVVHPGADPGKISMKYEGQQSLSIKKNQLLIATSVGVVKEWIPRSYQLEGNEKKDLTTSYFISGGNSVGFTIRDYSPDATLVIDPQEIFCSFSGSRSDNWGYTATYDGSGDLYMGGIVLSQDPAPDPSGNGYPATTGAFQTSFQGGDGSEGDSYDYDVAIMKLSPNGSTRLFATYLGGSGDEQPHSMVCDPQGNLVVTGRTSSVNFPVVGNDPYSGKGFDLFVTKFNAGGTALIGSLRIGGSGDDGVNNSPKYLNTYGLGAQELRLNYGDDGRSEVILDAFNNIYVASCTRGVTTGADDFPTTPGVFQPAFGGGDQDGVLLKISPDVSNLLFSSYLGGNNTDAAFVLALSPVNNDIYVAGGTISTDLKGTGNGQVVNASNQGGIDGFISMISNDGTTQFKTSYIGTGSTDMIYGLDIDNLGFPYIMGTTDGVIAPVNSPFNQNNNQSSGKQFITKLQPDLSAVVYSANFGPGGQPHPNISPTAFLVDRCENVYVAGWGGGVDIDDQYANSSTTGLVPTAGAIKSTTDGEDFYFFVLQKNAASQLYGSFFGQNGGKFGDHVDGGTSRFDKHGVIYEAICANCYGGAVFPTTAGVAAPVNGTGSAGCNEAAVKIALNFSGVAAGLKSTLQGRGDSLGCVPLQATLQDTIRNAKSYIWDFGDGSPVLNTPAAGGYIQQHIYTSVGTYRVMLIAIDSNTCNISDTTYINITARNDAATLDFKFAKVGDCKSTDYDFFNLSTPFPGKPFGDSSFAWYFSDLPAGTRVPGGKVTDTVNHAFPGAGTYTVTLMLIDSNYCNYPADSSILLSIAQNVKAQFVTPSSGCAPYTAVFNNTSLGGQQFFWDFGDGSSSTDRTPAPHLYPTPGVYPIRLIVIDSSTCNIADTTNFTLTVSGKPAAGFTFSPVPAVANTPTVFANTSIGGIRYIWLFGDGTSEAKTTMDTVVHQYNMTDTFNACLVAINQSGCADTTCQPVAAVIHPLLDVPNAFTPGRFGQNGIVKVVGFGITHMTFRIYNRWGQLVFESNNKDVGWDGTFRGVVQPMDVYVYTLEAEFSDGTHATRKGDITLIR